MQHNSVRYIVGFAAAVCVVCSLLVSSAATLLKPRQDLNIQLDKKIKVLVLTGLIEEGAKPSASEVESFFSTEGRVRMAVVDLEKDTIVSAEEAGIDNLAEYDQRKAAKDPATSHPVDKNPSRIASVPDQAVIFQIFDEAGEPEMIVFPVEGMGLWGVLYGYIAIDIDGNTIRGLTFYEHKETPGLGAEVDNPLWKAKWPDRLVYNENWEPAIRVIKGVAGTAKEAPHEVDGLSGATLTSNGVTNLLRFWLGDEGFGPYLANLRAERSDA